MLTHAEIASEFHTLYYESKVWRHTYWHATPVLKCPFDLWIYQELISRLRPDLIIECGTWAGGSSLFMAHMLDILKHGRIITIDILTAAQVEAHYTQHLPHHPQPLSIRPEHPRIRQIIGSSTDPAIVAQVHKAARNRGVVLVVADSDHSFEHTRDELASYHSLVTPGSYFVMEDTNIPNDGPKQAVEHFLRNHPEFEVARELEKFQLTFNPGGFLRRQTTVVHREPFT
jgi:cephalosporin hydroxylase